MRKILLLLPLLVLSLSLEGCASFGMTAPKGFDQQLATAYATHTAIVVAADQALVAKAIPLLDAQRVEILANEARQFLDAAKEAENAGDLSTAAGKLALGVNILTQVQAYLNSRKH